MSSFLLLVATKTSAGTMQPCIIQQRNTMESTKHNHKKGGMKSFSPTDGDKAKVCSTSRSNNAASPSSLHLSLASMLKPLSVMDIANICIVDDNAQLPSNELLTKISLECRRGTATSGGGRFRHSRRQCKRSPTKRSPTNRRRRSSSKTTTKPTPVVQEIDDKDSDYLDSSTETLASVFKEIEDYELDLSIDDIDPFMEVERWGESPRVSSNGRKGHHNGHQQRFSDHQDTSLVYPDRRISYSVEESPILPQRSMLLLPPPPPPSNEEVPPPIHSPTSVMDIGKSPLR